MPPYRQRSCVLFCGQISKRAPYCFLECTVRRWALNPFHWGIQRGFVTPTTLFLTVWGQMDHGAQWQANQRDRPGIQTSKWKHTQRNIPLQRGWVAYFKMHSVALFNFASFLDYFAKFEVKRESADKRKWTITKLRKCIQGSKIFLHGISWKPSTLLNWLRIFLLSIHKVFLKVK